MATAASHPRRGSLRLLETGHGAGPGRSEEALGFDKFASRGARPRRTRRSRMALDHPDVLTKLAILEIVPTYTLYQHITRSSPRFFTTGFCSFSRRHSPKRWSPNSAEYFLSPHCSGLGDMRSLTRFPTAGAETFGSLCVASAIPSRSRDMRRYRAAASIDLAHDAGGPGPENRIARFSSLWSEKGPFIACTMSCKPARTRHKKRKESRSRQVISSRSSFRRN